MFSPINRSRGPRDTYLPPGIKQAMDQYSQNAQQQGEPPLPGVPGVAPQVITPGGQDQNPGQPQSAAAFPQTAPTPTPASTNPDQAYDFINNPIKPPRDPLINKIAAGSPVTKAALAIGILILFIIIIAVFKNITGRSSAASAAALTTVVQDQQELLHLASESAQQTGLAPNHQNFAVTLQLSVGSSQGQLINYLLAGKKKLSSQQLNLKVSTSIDSQLSAAITANEFDQTFQQIMESQLTSYSKDLQKAYAQDKGPHARSILDDSYQQVKLLYTQLTSQTSS